MQYQRSSNRQSDLLPIGHRQIAVE
jgi:hypothetical protein